MIINFTKMHGLGNDFMVIDAISQDISLSSQDIQFLSNRNFGIGFDQLLLVESPISDNADFKYRIYNADGGEVMQCGNGARCFARFVRDKKLSDKNDIRVDTGSGQLLLSFDDDGLITVNMGIPKHKPSEIPTSAKKEALTYDLSIDNTNVSFGTVSMGNPHAVIHVDSTEDSAVDTLGKSLESHPFFPERANIGFMQIIDRQHIKLRVYERGTAETLACGSGACAAVVIGIEQNLLNNNKNIRVELPDGQLLINWAGRSHPVFMKGPAVSVFEGQIEVHETN